MVKGGGQRKSDTPSARSRESGEAIAKCSTQSPNVRRNCPWTEAEHRLFLLGLEEFGRGNWRDIAARYVSTRTPTQVASHAQKYFLREGLPASRKEKRRPSIHDIRSATEAPAMTADERATLRNSLQLINRSSMESIDTSALEGGRQGFRHITGAAFGRNYSRNHTLETGSSGEVSTGAGDRNTYSSRRESISEEEPFMRPVFLNHGKDSCDGFPELPEGEEVREEVHHTASLPPAAEQRANWHTSSLFVPVQLPPSDASQQPPCSKPVTAADRKAHMFRRGSFEVMPSGSTNMMLLGTTLHGGVMPEQAAMLPHAHSFADLLQQPQNPLAGPGLPGHTVTTNNSSNSSGRIGLPEEFPAAYPVRPSFSDEPAACVYNDGLSMSDVPACAPHAGCIPNQFGWGGMGGFGGHGPLSLGCKSGAGLSDTVYGSDCDQLTTGPTRTSIHSDFAPVMPSSPMPPMHHNPNVYVMPTTMMDRSQSQHCAHVSTGLDLYGRSNSQPMPLPSTIYQQPQAFPQEQYVQNVQHVPNAQVTSDPLFGRSPTEEAAFSYCPSIEDFRGLALSCGNDDLLIPNHGVDQEML